MYFLPSLSSADDFCQLASTHPSGSCHIDFLRLSIHAGLFAPPPFFFFFNGLFKNDRNRWMYSHVNCPLWLIRSPVFSVSSWTKVLGYINEQSVYCLVSLSLCRVQCGAAFHSQRVMILMPLRERERDALPLELLLLLLLLPVGNPIETILTFHGP